MVGYFEVFSPSYICGNLSRSKCPMIFKGLKEIFEDPPPPFLITTSMDWLGVFRFPRWIETGYSIFGDEGFVERLAYNFELIFQSVLGSAFSIRIQCLLAWGQNHVSVFGYDLVLRVSFVSCRGGCTYIINDLPCVLVVDR